MKGQISTAGWITIALVVVLVFGSVVYITQLSITPAVSYDGVFKELGKNQTELEYPFYSHFKIYTATLSSGSVSSTGNMTLEVANGTTIDFPKQYQGAYYFKISGGSVRNLNIEYDVDSTNDVFDPDSILLESAELWNYDEKSKIATLPIDSEGEIDYDTGVLPKGEYVIILKYSLKTDVTPSATEGTADAIGYLSLSLDTDEDPSGAEADEINDIPVTTLTV
ncbi:MAG: hypothetical protein J7K62_03260 [Thermoplasmata archaeon]|nr:hypothetical protein [Thermoplasmata archaeon]